MSGSNTEKVSGSNIERVSGSSNEMMNWLIMMRQILLREDEKGYG